MPVTILMEHSEEAKPEQSFSEWVKENGGNDSFVSILAQFGFSSRLSLKFLDLTSEDGEKLTGELRTGYQQWCELHLLWC